MGGRHPRPRRGLGGGTVSELGRASMRVRSTSLTAIFGLAAAGALVVPTTGAASVAAAPASPPAASGRTATSIGYGGGVSSVDPAATRAGLRVLRMGGNAVDAAIATAAALGVTEPYSSGIGGGGYFVFYNADEGQGADDRRPRDRAGRDDVERVHRPGDGQALQLHARAGHQRRLRRRARHAGHVGQGAAALGHLAAGRGAQAGDQAGRPRLPGRPHVPPADRRERRRASRRSPPPARSTCPAAPRRRSARR